MARLTGAALEAARRAHAASIKPGWAPQALADWIPKKEKPTVQMLADRGSSDAPARRARVLATASTRPSVTLSTPRCDPQVLSVNP